MAFLKTKIFQGFLGFWFIRNDLSYLPNWMDEAHNIRRNASGKLSPVSLLSTVVSPCSKVYIAWSESILWQTVDFLDLPSRHLGLYRMASLSVHSGFSLVSPFGYSMGASNDFAVRSMVRFLVRVIFFGYIQSLHLFLSSSPTRKKKAKGWGICLISVS